MTQRQKPVFKKEDPNGFYQNLKIYAKLVIEQEQKKACIITWIKVITYPTIYIFFLVLLLFNGSNLVYFYTCYAAMGIMVTIIVFNIVHDAIHHALFTQPHYNKRAALILDFLGGNSFVWSKRHVLYHHTFTNVPGWDVDVQQSKLVRFNPKQHYLKAHQYQHIYMLLLYLFYSLNWILIRDYKDFFSKASLIRRKTKIDNIEYWKLFFFKVLNMILLIALPVILLQHTWWHYLLAYIIMHWCTSAFTMLVLLPSHLDEDACFPEPDKNLQLEDSWAVHQLKVTNDFGTNQPLLNFVMGGLNHHIAHHLFPSVNHNIIPKLTQHIAKAAEQHGLPYKCYSLKNVMVSHYKLLKKNSLDNSFWEE